MKWIFSFLLLIMAGMAWASPSEEARLLLDQYQHLTQTDQRLEAFSNNFLGAPYGKDGPLGEGPQGRYDQDPLYRFDTFDCTTFVETIVSLSLAKDVLDFESIQNTIRYQNGDVDFLKRNHFPSLQWIPENVTNGILSEINDLLIPNSLQLTAKAIINIPGWFSKLRIEQIQVPEASQEERKFLLDELKSLGTQFSAMEASIDYIPINLLVEQPHLLKLIPNGTIINFVRPNWDLTASIGTHMNISHQGLVFVRKNGPLLRHASTSGLVKEEPLLDYLKNFVNHPTLKGIHLMKVN